MTCGLCHTCRLAKKCRTNKTFIEAIRIKRGEFLEEENWNWETRKKNGWIFRNFAWKISSHGTRYFFMHFLLFSIAVVGFWKQNLSYFKGNFKNSVKIWSKQKKFWICAFFFFFILKFINKYINIFYAFEI